MGQGVRIDLNNSKERQCQNGEGDCPVQRVHAVDADRDSVGGTGEQIQGAKGSSEIIYQPNTPQNAVSTV